MAFSEPYLSNKIKFITLKGKHIPYQNLQDLEDKVIGVVRDYSYDEAFMAADFLNRYESNSLESNLLKLVDGRIDLTLEDEIVALHSINNDNEIKKEAKRPCPLIDGCHKKTDGYTN